MKITMPVTQIWFSTPVDYLKVGDKHKEALIDALLKTDGVCEVEHYSEFNIRCDMKSDSDEGMLAEISAIRSKVECVFKSFNVWPSAPKHNSPRG